VGIDQQVWLHACLRTEGHIYAGPELPQHAFLAGTRREFVADHRCPLYAQRYVASGQRGAVLTPRLPEERHLLHNCLLLAFEAVRLASATAFCWDLHVLCLSLYKQQASHNYSNTCLNQPQ
jgi:hypothetical protein